MLGHQLCDLTGHALRRELQIQHQRSTTRQITGTVAVLVDNADFVQQFLGQIGIKLGVMLFPFRIDEIRGRRESDILFRLTEIEESDFVDLCPVHRHRHSLAELQVTEDLAFFLIQRGDVEGEGRHGDGRLQVHRVAALFLVLQHDRRRRKLHGLRLVVDLAVHRFQDAHLVLVDVHFVNFTDVGKLVPRRVDHVEIRVRHQVTALGRFSHDDVGFQSRVNALRHFRRFLRVRQHDRGRVGPVRISVIGGNHRIAALETELLRLRVRIRIVFRMECAQEMLRHEGLGIMRREVGEQTRLRCRQVEHHGLRIGRFHRHPLSGDQHVILRAFDDVLVEHHVVVPELDVLGSEWCTVGPFVALAERHGQLREVAVPFPALGHVRHDCRQIVAVAYKADMPDGQQIRGTGFGRV